MNGRKRFLQGALCAYALQGTIAGFAMKAVIPALNPLGIVYVGMTWPIASGCIALRSECSSVPPQRYASWLFSFDGDAA